MNFYGQYTCPVQLYNCTPMTSTFVFELLILKKCMFVQETLEFSVKATSHYKLQSM